MSRLNLLYSNDVEGQYPPSYYAATANELPPFPELDADTTCDVCIIGAGYTGLSAALHLAEAGLDVVLLEAHRVGWGASGRNGGQVCSGPRVDIEDLEKSHGVETAKQLWQIAEDAKALLAERIKRHKIDCDYKLGYLYCLHRKRKTEGTRAYADKLNDRYDYPHIRYVDGEEVRDMVGSPGYFGGLLDTGAGHIHPLNFALGLARAASEAGARIFERSPVQAYQEGSSISVKTNKATVKAGHLLLACNGYLGNLDNRVSSRVMPINNFIIATEPFDEATARQLIRDDVAVCDSRFVVNYYRLSQDRRMLFGGGENYSYKFPADIKSFVRKPMLEVYPQLKDARIDYGWGGTLGITMSRLPQIARLSPNVLTASGYSGQGVALGTLCGKLMADVIVSTSKSFDIMASMPPPRFPGGAMLRWPLLVLAMTWYSLHDRL